MGPRRDDAAGRVARGENRTYYRTARQARDAALDLLAETVGRERAKVERAVAALAEAGAVEVPT